YASEVFDIMSEIYVVHKCVNEPLVLFHQMQLEELKHDFVAMMSMLLKYTPFGTLEQCSFLCHFINIYVISWSSMVVVCGKHGATSNMSCRIHCEVMQKNFLLALWVLKHIEMNEEYICNKEAKGKDYSMDLVDLMRSFRDLLDDKNLVVDVHWKDNVFKNMRGLMESAHKSKEETAREKNLSDKFEA
ncbi:hypothetical protein KI387_029176, partial [Taxus chinensis]